jgi:hypothetical protein
LYSAPSNTASINLNHREVEKSVGVVLSWYFVVEVNDGSH